jgi:hypothetical protein
MMSRVAALLPEPYRGIYSVSQSIVIEIDG